uniref:Uncharacterized protein n=1 Tax=Trichuris muris TaxID=70415 RepID=A0A5S6QRR8_TRIMR
MHAMYDWWRYFRIFLFRRQRTYRWSVAFTNTNCLFPSPTLLPIRTPPNKVENVKRQISKVKVLEDSYVCLPKRPFQ